MSINAAVQPTEWHPVVTRLLQRLEADTALKSTLLEAIETSQRFDEPQLQSYCYLVHRMQTTVPNPKTWLPMNLEFYYVMACASDDSLNRHPGFMQWVRDYVESIGQWMDSPESMQAFQTFTEDALYAVDDYIAPPGGWLTYNQFFARQIKSGARPIDEPHNDRVIVAAADSSFCGCQPITDTSTVTAKGLSWSIRELLAGSPHAEAFANGWYGHSFLAPHNYHRFHTPVRGKVVELRTIMGQVAMDVHALPDGSLSVERSAIGYQFQQERGLAILETAIGLVAVIPIGMGIVSSVTFSALPNSWLEKGSELGFFSFGGSDVVLVFQQQAQVSWQVQDGDVCRQGKVIALAGGSSAQA